MNPETLARSAHDVYSLLLISLVLSPLTLPVALVISLYRLAQSRGNYLASHFHYALGNLVQYPMMLTLVILCWRWTAAQQFFRVQGNIFPPLIIYPTLVVLPLAWWIWRFVQGYRLLKAGQGIANPYSPGKIYPASQP
ncbi:MAG: hypothetical protein Q4D61_01395 [Cardiobacteriaceae bacterium]|nr:hypothetical protein [Cardiobacteriaceae bacterium]